MQVVLPSNEKVMKEYVVHNFLNCLIFRNQQGTPIGGNGDKKCPLFVPLLVGLGYIRHEEIGCIFGVIIFYEHYNYLDTMIQCPDLIKKIGEKSLELVEKNYRSEKYYEGVISIWNRMNSF